MLNSEHIARLNREGRYFEPLHITPAETAISFPA